jgi:hypothetical protein
MTSGQSALANNLQKIVLLTDITYHNCTYVSMMLGIEVLAACFVA